MKHEDDPQNSRRRDEDSHVANSAGGAGSSRDALEVSDQNSARLRPSRGTDQLPDEQVLTGTGRFAAVAFHGPIPPPSVIKDYNRISEGLVVRFSETLMKTRCKTEKSVENLLSLRFLSLR